MMDKNLALLEEHIDYEFKNQNLLRQALTHRSYLNENPNWDLDHNERLEFLGDAVLELVVTEYLYTTYPNPEGELTNWRAALVNAAMLSKIAGEFGLNEFLLLSRGEAKDVGRARQYILANAMEALIGAIYLDGRYKKAEEFIHRFILVHLQQIIEQRLYRDAKSLLQEYVQERIGFTPIYKVMEEWGPDHARQFRVGVYLHSDFKEIGVGEGPSKQEAQQKAAENAIKELEKMDWKPEKKIYIP